MENTTHMTGTMVHTLAGQLETSLKPEVPYPPSPAQTLKLKAEVLCYNCNTILGGDFGM